MKTPTTPSNWHDRVFFGMHYDLHATTADTQLGAELTAAHLRETLQSIKPDWVQCDCKGHAGYTSWPTKIGTPSPGIVKDALRIHRNVTRELGIPLGMHYSGVWDTRAIELHPKWARVNADGNRDKNQTCRLHGYAEKLMIPQLLELIDEYDVDGFWIDGENWASGPCYCDRCSAEFTKRTGIKKIPRKADDANWFTWLAFHRDLFEEHVTAYINAIHARKPGCLVCSNWMYTVRQPDPVGTPVDYLSGDYDWAYGSNRAAIEGRVLDGRKRTNGLSWDLMAWGFGKTHDMHGPIPWQTKPALHLKQEIAEVVALGGAVMIYDQPQRSGWLTKWHTDIFAEVAAFCRERKTICFNTQSVPQAAVLHLAGSFYEGNDPLYNYGRGAQPLEGALHALLETHRSADVLTQDAIAAIADYPLVIVPEQTHLSKKVITALEQYAHNGGHVLITGDFVARQTPALVGAKPKGKLHAAAVYLAVGNAAVGIAGPWQIVTPSRGTHSLVKRLAQQEPTKDRTSNVLVTRRRVGKGSIVAIHGPIFRQYLRTHYPLLREFIGDLINGFDIPWTVEADAPARLEIVLRRNDDQLLINLINRGSGAVLEPNRNFVDDLPPIFDITLRVRTPQRPQSVTFEPARSNTLKWSFSNRLTTIHIPKVDIHNVVILR